MGQSYETGAAAAEPAYDLSWHTVDTGGAMSTAGGEYELSGTIGQPDAGGPITGGAFELSGGFWVAGTVPAAQLESSEPLHNGSLWRSAGNIVRLTFLGSVAQPVVGDVEIQELLDGGEYGPDLSGSFSFDLESGGTVLKVRETWPTLTHRTWYAVRNTGTWAGVTPFEVHYQVQVGDANGDGRVLYDDLSMVNSGVPIFATDDDDRRDINGDGSVLFSDISAANASVPSLAVPKPGGH